MSEPNAVPVSDVGSISQPRKRTWEVLNSNLVVALVSIGGLGGIGSLWNTWHESQARNADVRREARLILSDLTYRTLSARREVENYVLQHPDATDLTIGNANVLIWRIALGGEGFQPSLPRFKDSPIAGLISQLQVLGVDDKDTVAAQASLNLEHNNPDIKQVTLALDQLDSYVARSRMALQR